MRSRVLNPLGDTETPNGYWRQRKRLGLTHGYQRELADQRQTRNIDRNVERSYALERRQLGAALRTGASKRQEVKRQNVKREAHGTIEHEGHKLFFSVRTIMMV